MGRYLRFQRPPWRVTNAALRSSASAISAWLYTGLPMSASRLAAAQCSGARPYRDAAPRAW